MLKLKRPPLQRRADPRSLDALGLVDQLLLHIGPNEDAETLRTEGDMLALWEANREALSTMATGPDDPLRLIQHAPGERTWPHWRFELLPAHPRRRVQNDPGLSAFTDNPPSLEPWSCDGYESSYMYLRRRGLLKPGEEDAIRVAWPLDQVCRSLAAHRAHARADQRHAAFPPLPAHELAGLVLLYDPDGSEELLTAEERGRALVALEVSMR